MKRKVAGILSFFLGLVLILVGISSLFTTNSLLGMVKSEPKGSIDYICVGDSECRTGISPMRIWEKTGLHGYNCGVTAQPIQETYYDLVGYFKAQKPKVVVMETNELYREQTKTVMAENEVVHTADRLLSIYQNHGDWKNFLAHKRTIQDQKNEKEILCGWHYKLSNRPYYGGTYMWKTDRREPIGQTQLKYLDAIRVLCKKNGTELILVSAPSPKNWNMMRHNTVEAYSRQYGIRFEDLNLQPEKTNIDWADDSADAGDHLNIHGALKVTDCIADVLQDAIQSGGTSELKVSELKESDKEWSKRDKTYTKLMKQTKVKNEFAKDHV